jgi:hypothetical protein
MMDQNQTRLSLPAQEWLGYDPEKGDIHGYTFEQMREFGDTIVRECASIAHAGLSPAVAQAIQKRFGVSYE